MIWDKRRLLAEGIGTFGLVLIGTGAIIIEDETAGQVSHFGVSLAFGLIVTAMIIAFGKVSGAHINPAVSFGFWAGKHFHLREIAPYCFAQFLGAIGASLLLSSIFSDHHMLGGTLPIIGIWKTLILEYFLTFILMMVILVFSQGPKRLNRFTAWMVGTTVFLEAYLAGPLTGASMNPARSLGPALVSMNLNHVWIYLIATTLGAISAGLLWAFYTNRIKNSI